MELGVYVLTSITRAPMSIGSALNVLLLGRSDLNEAAGREALEPYRAAFESARKATGVPAALLMGVAMVESGGDPHAVNPSSRTVGLMQIHPIHFDSLRWIGPTTIDPDTRTGSGGVGWSDPARNVLAGATILRDYIKRENGDIVRGLARYNGAATWLEDPDSNAPAAVGFRHYARNVLSWANIFAT